MRRGTQKTMAAEPGALDGRGWAESFLMQLARMVNSFGAGHVHGVQRIGHGLQVSLGQLQINDGVLKLDMPEQQLDRTQVGAGFQQMRRVRIAQ